jgi:hypothetical protein
MRADGSQEDRTASNAVFTGHIALSTATGFGEGGQDAEGAQQFFLAIFVDVGHLRRPIIRASPDSLAERPIP